MASLIRLIRAPRMGRSGAVVLRVRTIAHASSEVGHSPSRGGAGKVCLEVEVQIDEAAIAPQVTTIIHAGRSSFGARGLVAVSRSAVSMLLRDGLTFATSTLQARAARTCNSRLGWMEHRAPKTYGRNGPSRAGAGRRRPEKLRRSPQSVSVAVVGENMSHMTGPWPRHSLSRWAYMAAMMAFPSVSRGGMRSPWDGSIPLLW